MAFKEEKLVLLRTSVPASGRLCVGFQELVDEVASGRGQWSHRPCWPQGLRAVVGPTRQQWWLLQSARIGVDLCPLKLSGLGGLGASLPRLTTLPPSSKAPLWLECFVQVGLWGLLRRTFSSPSGSSVRLLEGKETLRDTYCLSLCLAWCLSMADRIWFRKQVCPSPLPTLQQCKKTGCTAHWVFWAGASWPFFRPSPHTSCSAGSSTEGERRM